MKSIVPQANPELIDKIAKAQVALRYLAPDYKAVVKFYGHCPESFNHFWRELTNDTSKFLATAVTTSEFSLKELSEYLNSRILELAEKYALIGQDIDWTQVVKRQVISCVLTHYQMTTSTANEESKPEVTGLFFDRLIELMTNNQTWSNKEFLVQFSFHIAVTYPESRITHSELMNELELQLKGFGNQRRQLADDVRAAVNTAYADCINPDQISLSHQNVNELVKIMNSESVRISLDQDLPELTARLLSRITKKIFEFSYNNEGISRNQMLEIICRDQHAQSIKDEQQQAVLVAFAANSYDNVCANPREHGLDQLYNRNYKSGGPDR